MALAIRWLHVAAMSVAFGGAFLVAWLSYRTSVDRLIETASRYEQAFWAAAGVLVMTGIGNLGAFGENLFEPGTAWGTTFIAKLWLVAALIAVSLPRSLVVALLASQDRPQPVDLRPVYTVTTGMFAVIVAFAIVLAHQ
ncbi:MAG TPA: CopD family protein [Candidatus Limnocylindria bacterium]|nr:CopD family protein [Candidatus Limnocylindria bacterium]